MPQRKTKTSFTKGNTRSRGNRGPKGRTKADREQLAVKKIDLDLVTNYFTINSHLTPHELVARLRTQKVSMLEAMIIKGMLRAYRTGDTFQINFFIERLVGKVPNKIEHSVKNPYEGMSIDQLMAEKIRLTELNRKTLDFIETTNERVITLEKEVKEYVDNGSPAPGTDSGN